MKDKKDRTVAKTETGGNIDGYIRQLSPEQGYALLDKQTRQHFGISANEFIEAWRAGKFRDEEKYPEAVGLAMMIPLAV